MSLTRSEIQMQINLIEEAMKKAGVWSADPPTWITDFQEGNVSNIWQWLQYIHLPMRLHNVSRNHQYLAPQLMQHLGSDPGHLQILQLIIELDSISPTL